MTVTYWRLKMTEFKEGQLDALRQLKERMIGRVVNGTLLSVIIEEDIAKLEYEIRSEKKSERSTKGVY